MLLANCFFSEALKYRNKLVVVSKEEEKKKPEEVWLNILVEDEINEEGLLEEVYSKGLGAAKCITVVSHSPKRCPDNFKGKVYRFYKYLEDYEEAKENLKSIYDFSNIINEVEGVIPLISLPDGFCDMRFVYNLSKKYPTARFTGGNLLEIPGIKIGRFDKGKEKMSAVYNGVYDICKEVCLGDIEVREVMAKVRTKSSVSGSRVKKTAPKKANSKAKKVETFTKFFGSGGCEF